MKKILKTITRLIKKKKKLVKFEHEHVEDITREIKLFPKQRDFS